MIFDNLFHLARVLSVNLYKVSSGEKTHLCKRPTASSPLITLSAQFPSNKLVAPPPSESKATNVAPVFNDTLTRREGQRWDERWRLKAHVAEIWDGSRSVPLTQPDPPRRKFLICCTVIKTHHVTLASYRSTRRTTSAVLLVSSSATFTLFFFSFCFFLSLSFALFIWFLL